MLNILWAAMILLGTVCAVFTGKIPSLTEACLSSAKEAVALAVTMAGIVSLWSGIMEIASCSGILTRIVREDLPSPWLPVPLCTKGSPRFETYLRQYDRQYLRPGMGSDSGRPKSHGGTGKAGG